MTIVLCGGGLDCLLEVRGLTVDERAADVLRSRSLSMLMPAPAIGSTLVQALASRVGSSSGPATAGPRN